MDCSLPGSSVHGIPQARILEWVAQAERPRFPGPLLSRIRGPDRTSLPSPSPSHHSRMIQSPWLSFLSHTANSRWLSIYRWRRQWHPTPVLLPRKFHGWRSLVGYSPWGRKESDTTEHTEETRKERDTCTPMFIAALFIIARTWKQPRCPSADEWIRKRWYIYTMEYRYWVL